ncbi:hypothetical protein COCON_G00040740 [Conger conger]|uniref:Tetratricopeptide repeat protein 1 n=1 Tax=Conger conger TaxID=82655 RepID=A0A9Q1DTJ3_CONCO|nr:hypothetical protein COCON_G00040740 [Conger conger]
MESGMEEERFTEVLSTLTVSERRGSPEGSAGGHVPAATPPGGPEQDDDSFFDCRETLEEDGGGRTAGAEPRRVEGEGGEEWGERGERESGGGESGTEFREEEKEELVDDGKDDSDSELKEELKEEVEEEVEEFDEERLRELEKDMSEEEKERRREESLRLKETGNGQFKKGEHAEAEASYTAALVACPLCDCSRERSILFSNRAAARLHLDKKEKAIADCTKAIELNPGYVRAILRRAELYEKTDKLDEALEDYKNILEKDPAHHQAREACMRLPGQIQERNEKLKEEMMGKLKDLGNMFLRPFGLSTSNFQVNQDTSSGSYSVNFVQNPNNNNSTNAPCQRSYRRARKSQAHRPGPEISHLPDGGLITPASVPQQMRFDRIKTQEDSPRIKLPGRHGTPSRVIPQTDASPQKTRSSSYASPPGRPGLPHYPVRLTQPLSWRTVGK